MRRRPRRRSCLGAIFVSIFAKTFLVIFSGALASNTWSDRFALTSSEVVAKSDTDASSPEDTGLTSGEDSIRDAFCLVASDFLLSSARRSSSDWTTCFSSDLSVGEPTDTGTGAGATAGAVTSPFCSNFSIASRCFLSKSALMSFLGAAGCSTAGVGRRACWRSRSSRRRRCCCEASFAKGLNSSRFPPRRPLIGKTPNRLGTTTH